MQTIRLKNSPLYHRAYRKGDIIYIILVNGLILGNCIYYKIQSERNYVWVIYHYIMLKIKRTDIKTVYKQRRK